MGVNDKMYKYNYRDKKYGEGIIAFSYINRLYIKRKWRKAQGKGGGNGRMILEWMSEKQDTRIYNGWK